MAFQHFFLSTQEGVKGAEGICMVIYAAVTAG